ncbi:MAG: hypothetical protein A2Y12_18755 [Planctomycetes bacterium GWF2_42_9]|nr:MAG: hypothetical protein A2Y12_18755 [Planctomycetes bacterium GWF2_42_9]
MLEDKNNQTIEDRLFSRKKSLLTVQQYANSQGISAGVVNECAKLGVIQVRKHKNKTFIVDLPLDAGKNAKQLEDDKIEQVNTVEQAQKITSMVNKIFQPSIQNSKPVISKPETKTQPAVKVEVAKPQAAIPDLKLFAQEEKKAQVIRYETKPVPQFKVSLMRKISDSFKISFINRVILGMLSIGIILSICAFWSISYQNKIHQKQLQTAYANIGKLVGEYDSAKRQAKLYELDSSNWRSEAQRSQKSIASLEIELVNAKEKLEETQSSLSNMQQNHVDTLKNLNKQIEEITSKIKTSKKEN